MAGQKRRTSRGSDIPPNCLYGQASETIGEATMDMNDILNQWDKIQADKIKKQKENKQPQVSHKKANAPTPEEKELAKSKLQAYDEENNKQINPMEFWLRRYGTIDKDKLQEETDERIRQSDHNYLREMKPEARIDLHGLHQDEAEQRLDNFVGDCKKRGIKKIMIVHGKGIHSHGSDPVLGELVRKFIERDKRLGMSGHPDRTQGGSGATWVIIK